MEGILFVLLIGAVLVVIARRKGKKKKARTKQLDLPARTPDTAEIVQSPKQIDTFVRRQRCHCKGRVYVCAESPVSGFKGMRVAVCECIRCEEVHRFYFEMEYLN